MTALPVSRSTATEYSLCFSLRKSLVRPEWLNVSVKIDCINRRDATKNFTQVFREGENYDANKQFSDVENGLINTIFERLVQQIFNRTFGNW